jgi:phage terminase large subunit
MAAQNVVIPYCPRPQFEAYHDRTERFAKIVAHRRFGKTVGCINDMIKAALCSTRVQPPPRFAYIAPTYSQAKDVAWGYLKHFSAVIPGLKMSESELWVEYPNGARIRLYGADNYDRMRGLYHDGVTIDEPAQMDPRAWPEVIRPTLSDYSGWGTFIGTPAGRDWFYKIDLSEDGTKAPDFFRLTLKASETGIIPEAELKSLMTGLTDEQYAQEFECSFEAAIVGSYYGKAMRQAEADKRIAGVPCDRELRVYTAWDLGYRDATAIWFVQVVGREIRLIDYYEAIGTDIADDVKAVLDKPYSYAGHIIPHDGFSTSKQTGKTTAQMMENLGLRDLERAPDHRVEDGINQSTLFLSRCWFDAIKCSRGIDCMKMYRAEFDEKLETLKPRPLHNWASHGADAFRYLSMTLDSLTGMKIKVEEPEEDWVV